MRYPRRLIFVFLIFITNSLIAQTDDQLEGWGIAEVSIKATTTEKLSFVGREEGVSAYAVALLQKID